MVVWVCLAKQSNFPRILHTNTMTKVSSFVGETLGSEFYSSNSFFLPGYTLSSAACLQHYLKYPNWPLILILLLLYSDAYTSVAVCVCDSNEIINHRIKSNDLIYQLLKGETDAIGDPRYLSDDTDNADGQSSRVLLVLTRGLSGIII